MDDLGRGMKTVLSAFVKIREQAFKETKESLKYPIQLWFFQWVDLMNDQFDRLDDPVVMAHLERLYKLIDETDVMEKKNKEEIDATTRFQA